jgi:hypothetical protein
LQVKLIKIGDVIPVGFELLERSISGKWPGYIDQLGTLAIKRASTSAVMFVQGEPLVDDICIVLIVDGEEFPEGYVSLERGMQVTKEGAPVKAGALPVDKITIAYHQRPAMGLCDLSYESTTLDRYPEEVRSGRYELAK